MNDGDGPAAAFPAELQETRMAHQITVVETHRFDLADEEQYDLPDYHARLTRVVRMTVTITDGTVSSVRAVGYPVLKAGVLGKVEKTISIWSPRPENVNAIVRAHGIRVSS